MVANLIRPLYIFDIDGTIADIRHRLHYLDDLNDSKRWDRFYSACDKDLPNVPVIKTMERLRFTMCDIWFLSGRSNVVRDKTVAWLAENTSFFAHELNDILMMRIANDYTPDAELKKQWYDNMLLEDQQRLVAVFDDRKRVVGMWRDAGVACFQVAEGDF